MKRFNSLQDVEIGSSACAIGMFDGIHLGHRVVLEHAIRMSKIHGLESVVFTFANHPQSVISQTPTSLLSTHQERLDAFEAFGFDAVLMMEFTPDFKSIPAEDFVRQILLDTLHVKSVSIGYDHRFGQNRQGDGAFLKHHGSTLGFDTEVIEPVRVGDQIISSTLIRKLLSYGDLDRANTLLGKPYTLSGQVVQGVGRGKTIGFPTANVETPPQRLVPAQGVYVCLVTIDDTPTKHPAVCNIGLAPTFGDQQQSRVEVHLLDFEYDLYGKQLTLEFIHHLRGEQTFPSVNELITQIQKDCDVARHVLESYQ